jgi:hypothetical protein
LGGWLSVDDVVDEVLARAVMRAEEVIKVGVGHDAKQPRPNVRSLGKGVEAGVSLKHRFLHEIFGVHGVASQSAGAVVELVQIWEGVVDEPRGQLWVARSEQ